MKTFRSLRLWNSRGVGRRENDLVAAVTPLSGKKIDVNSLTRLCVKKLERNAVPSYFSAC